MERGVALGEAAGSTLLIVAISGQGTAPLLRILPASDAAAAATGWLDGPNGLFHLIIAFISS
jgi:hypothetical protein